jgi:hypothetical protein
MTTTTEAPIRVGPALKLSTSGGCSEELLTLGKIAIDGGTQARAGLDEARLTHCNAVFDCS